VNETIKILFDENFGEPLVSALAEFMSLYHEDVEICHLFKFAKASEKDEVWIPRIAPGGWLVVSTDRGKRCGGKKLPAICREHKVTHILLSTSLHDAKHFEKIRAFVAVWPRVVMAARFEKGTRYSLRYEGQEKRVALVQCDYPATPTLPNASARLGFDGRKRRSGHPGRKRKSSAIPWFERLFKDVKDINDGDRK